MIKLQFLFRKTLIFVTILIIKKQQFDLLHHDDTSTMFNQCRVNGLAVRRQAFGLFNWIVIGQIRQLADFVCQSQSN